MAIIKSKYKIKNNENYDTVYFETSADLVQETENKKFVTQQDKNSWNSKANVNHNHNNATSDQSGFMSPDDKKKLDKVSAAMGDFKIWSGTKQEYDAIAQKDSNTIYFIKES